MEFLKILLFCVSLIGWATLAGRIFRTNKAVSLFVGIQLVILSLYLFALVGMLRFGVIFCGVVGVLSLFTYLYRHLRETTPADIATISLFSLPFLAFTLTIPRDFRFTMFDEFPSWAANIKTMYTENGLAGIESATRGIAEGFYQSYPPFQQLFQHYFLQFAGWSEANVQAAQNLLALVLLLGVSGLVLNSNRKVIFPAWLGSISIYYLFGFTMSNLLADGLLSLQFAACIALALRSTKNSRDYFLLGLVIGNLILIKPTGFVLAVCAVLLSLSGLLTIKKVLKLRIVPILPKESWKLASYAVLLPGISYLSWQLHLRAIQMNPGVEGVGFANFFSDETKARWDLTWASYKENFFGSLYGADNLAGISSTAPRVVQILHISLFMIFLVLSISQIALALLGDRLERKSNLRSAFLLILLALFYQVFLLSLYMFFFGEYEGVRSAALVRYSSSFFLGWTIYVFGLFLIQLTKFKFSRLTVALTTLLLILASPGALAAELKGDSVNQSKLPARLDVEQLVPMVTKIVSTDERIYYLYQQSNGFEKHIFTYLVLPLQTNWSCPSLGKPYYEGDVWTCDTSLPIATQGYDFLAVGKADDLFWGSNSKYLAPGSNPQVKGLYKIERDNGSFQLQEVVPK